MASCGGGSSPTTPSTPAGPQTTAFSGTATTNGTGGCGGNSHTLATGTGQITVGVTQASAPRIKVQVCHPTAANHNTDCTVPPFATIAPGQPVAATLKGGRDQVVTVFPEACGAAGNPPASTVTYTISVTYPAG